MITPLVATLLGFALAYANGANDISKSIATLVGSGVSQYKTALIWGSVWTVVGAVLGAIAGSAMLTTFGKGLISLAVEPSVASTFATLLGAASWVLIATRTGLPVSTTHALVGSLVGVAGVAFGAHSIEWNAVAIKVLLPLIVSPVAAFFLTYALLLYLKGNDSTHTINSCICIETEEKCATAPLANTVCPPINLTGNFTPAITISVGDQQQCAKTQPKSLQFTLDHLHWLTSGATSLARGMNDAPKIVALMGAATISTHHTVSTLALFLFVSTGMLIGCLIGGRRVTQVLAQKITAMDHYEGFAANLVTATLVSTGAIYGLPMSTTHVSSGGIFSAGFKRGTLDKKVLRDILLAWIVTLPVAGILGILSYLVLNALIT